MSTTEKNLIKSSFEELRRHLAKFIVPYVDGKDYTETCAVLGKEDLDRAAAEKEMCAALNKGNFTGGDRLVKLSEAYSRFQTEQRTRRDMMIGRARHKRMLIGCLETAYRRERKLEQLIRGVPGKEVDFSAEIPNNLIS